ncbi:lipoprotein [Paralimibaculum aggregatum]|uniref:Lipoprotein n=1 Tax=Paralimibaculum aggregatum TaxID=3036245 RepID=A0ABQ6LLK9_9RHOB|nr:lipid-binding SYLF domain-containing protein [Limibaculum sp. NKW23]GMG81554.1 lipoprotein [Limibaculum sp. NKW23]
MLSRRLILSAICALGVLGLAAAGGDARAASAEELERKADATLETLKASAPVTQKMIDDAAGVLIFPSIVKGGFIIGASGGEGVLRARGKTLGYYQSAAASIGLQAGISAYGYVMFLMDDKALDFVRKTDGWEVGVGPDVTVADKGFADRLSSSSVKEGIYVFFVDQKGLFAGASIEGSKISPIAE